MKGDFVILESLPVQVNLEQVLQQCGYPQQTCASPDSRDRVSNQMQKALRLIEPHGAYLMLENVPGDGFELFDHAERMVLALTTIGPKLEEKAKELVNNGRGATGLIFDAVGTVAVENAANDIERQIRQKYQAENVHISRRYSPGYCGWDIQAQRQLFACFPDTIGIELNKSCLMIPEKSISFMCLLSNEGDFEWIKAGDCKRCEQKICPYRSAPFQKTLAAG